MMAESTQTCGAPEERDIKVTYLAKYVDRWLCAYRHYNDNIAVRLRQKLSGELVAVGREGGREREGGERERGGERGRERE